MSPTTSLPSSLHIIGGRKLGGAERFYARLVNALAARGAPVAAMTVAGGEIDAALAPGVTRHHAPLAGVWDLYSRWCVGRAARRYDIVQSYMGRATRLTHLPAGGRPVHIARLGGYYNLKGYRHAHAWVGNTEGIRAYLLEQGLPAGRVACIGNFVDPAPPVGTDTLNALRRDLGLAENARVILGLGRLHPNKGFADLLAAFARLPESLDGRPLRLLMVGDGPLRAALAAEAERLGIAARTLWAGWQYDPAPWYQLADVFVCSSRHEPLGNVVLEAWANRALVVSTAAQGPAELIAPEVDGLLAPLADPAALAAALTRALRLEPAARQAMVEAGGEKLSARFSEDTIVSTYLALYQRLLATA